MGALDHLSDDDPRVIIHEEAKRDREREARNVNNQTSPETQSNTEDAAKNAIEYDPNLTLFDLERRYILDALVFFNGNKNQTAAALGITIGTLRGRLFEYEENPHEQR